MRYRTALGAIGALPVVALIAACGGAPAAPASVQSSATGAPSTATASPSAAPQPPVVLIAQQASGTQTVLQAKDPSGSPLWSVPYPSPGPYMVAAGPRLFEVDSKAKTVSVFDRSGRSIGNGSGAGEVFSSTSAEWAWSTVDGTNPSPAANGSPVTVTGSFWVAGVGEAPHRVYQWTENDTANSLDQAYDRLVEWSDQGLVSSQPPPWSGCASGHQSGSFVVNPKTGARTDLDAISVVDVHDGLIVSAPKAADTAQSIVLSGRTSFTWADTAAPSLQPKGAYISPDGSRVAVAMLNAGCNEQPEAQTAIISVADHSVQYLSGAFAEGWLDDGNLVAQVAFDSSLPNPELDVVALDGTRHLVGSGRLVGVIRSS
ncbi:MAG: hypothetical protein JOZ75_09215 [Candidatus Dormibacteraeota bacterium]|nr:hypothetical protein [Candidatus Dormibacteraeota bacterium]